MILLSAHKDTVFNPYKLSYSKGVFKGLLDNYIGMLVCNSLMIEEPNLRILENQGKVGLHFGSGEEWGLGYDLPKLNKEDIVVVVDVAIGEQYKGLDFSLENISGFSNSEIKGFKEHLGWENFKLVTKKYNGNPDDEDESWKWIEQGNKVISFIIPIEGEGETGWHVDNCKCSIDTIVKAKNGLRRLINILL